MQNILTHTVVTNIPMDMNTTIIMKISLFLVESLEKIIKGDIFYGPRCMCKKTAN